MYSFETVLEGVKYTVYLFTGFTGIIQPFTPENPIMAEEVYRTIDKYQEAVYTQGWYVETKNGPRLDILKKVFLLAEPFEMKDKASKRPGVYFHRLVKCYSEVEIGQAITALESIHEMHFLRYVVDEQGELRSALHVYNNAYDKHTYQYNEAGRMIDRKREIEKEAEKIPDL
ncbi:MAG: hypothetical protein GY820_46040 [Gammaproteobacteria bacterium]|nr:hypothetical protein [Gammaproteobacteria bacterium]